MYVFEMHLGKGINMVFNRKNHGIILECTDYHFFLFFFLFRIFILGRFIGSIQYRSSGRPSIYNVMII